MTRFREAGARRALVLAVLLACAGCAPEEPETGWAEATLPRLSARARAAQLVVASPGRTAPERVRGWVREDSVGGVRLEGGGALAVVRSLAALRAAAPLPLLVAAELDGGAGALVPEATELPPPRVLAALGDAELAGEVGPLAAGEARALGVHLGLVRLPEAETEPAAALP
ncbi:MAG TPA: glycoside hydrolase family 3 N-terminal domain-containing protein, partial [Longimicrobiaceae bacterium]